jgi:beta-mannosidase
MPDHFIRLRGPWQCEPLARTVEGPGGGSGDAPGELPPPCRMNIPCRWADGGLGPFNGRVRLRRHFHWLAHLDYNQRIWLRFLAVDYYAKVWLNGQYLGAHQGAFDPFEFEVTRLVGPRNELVVEVDLPRAAVNESRMLRASAACPPDSGGIWGEVLLEVRRDASLRGLHVSTSRYQAKWRLKIGFGAYAEIQKRLEVYVLLNDRTVLYESIDAGPQLPFMDREILVPDAEPWWPASVGSPRLYDVRIELVEGGAKLDSQSRLTGFRTVGEGLADGAVVHRVNGKRADVATVDLSEPTTDAPMLESRDRTGDPVFLRLPLPNELPADLDLVRDAHRQTESLVAALLHHPAVVGWICPLGITLPENQRNLLGLIEAVDGTRLFDEP